MESWRIRRLRADLDRAGSLPPLSLMREAPRLVGELLEIIEDLERRLRRLEKGGSDHGPTAA